MLVVTIAVLLCAAVDIASAKYLYHPQIKGALKINKMIASWDEALHNCRSEGAVLASPSTESLKKELQALFHDTFYFIGLDARFQQNTFMSVEGVTFDEMPVSDMDANLDIDDGQCLSMNIREVRVAQCTLRMPYVCYKNLTGEQTISADCGTNGYTFEPSTYSCYKFYNERKTWTNAQDTCIAEGGYLAILNDNDEAKAIGDYITDKSFYVFIDLRYSTKLGTWTNTHDVPVVQLFNVWEGSSAPGHSTDACAGFDGYSPQKLKANLICSQNLPFICEKYPKFDI